MPEPEEETPEENINQIALTNSGGSKTYSVYSGSEFIKDIEPGSCFGYMIEEGKDLIIRFKQD